MKKNKHKLCGFYIVFWGLCYWGGANSKLAESCLLACNRPCFFVGRHKEIL